MAKTFFPEIYEHIQASPPHLEDAEYRVSIGLEKWADEEYSPVIKVQMVYNGQVAGRKPPSYPLGTDDHMRVQEAIERLMQQRYRSVIKEQNAVYSADNEN